MAGGVSRRGDQPARLVEAGPEAAMPVCVARSPIASTAGDASPRSRVPFAEGIEWWIDGDAAFGTGRLLCRVNGECAVARRMVAAGRERIMFRKPSLALASAAT